MWFLWLLFGKYVYQSDFLWCPILEKKSMANLIIGSSSKKNSRMNAESIFEPDEFMKMTFIDSEFRFTRYGDMSQIFELFVLKKSLIEIIMNV